MYHENYRGLEKYVGKYRVKARVDLDTNKFPTDESFEDLYIECDNGGELRHTYTAEKGELLMCYYNESGIIGRNVYKALVEKYGEKLYIEMDNDCGTECMLYFKEKDLSKVATIVKPKVNGAKISPWSSKNLVKAIIKINIPDEAEEQYRKIIAKLDQTQKLQMGKKCPKAFIESKKLSDELDETGLKAKDFIYSKGLWEEYIKFAKKYIKEV